MPAYKEMETGVDEAEAKRLTESLGLDKCPRPAEPRPSASELDRCGSRGKPVSVEELIQIFQQHGISLELDEDTCDPRPLPLSPDTPRPACHAGGRGLSPVAPVLDCPNRHAVRGEVRRPSKIKCRSASRSRIATRAAHGVPAGVQVGVRTAGVSGAGQPVG